MADKLLEDVQSFLDDVVSDLTNLHVKVSQALNAPSDDDAVEALAKLPAGLIDRAQALSASLDERVARARRRDDAEGVPTQLGGNPKAKAKAKAAAK